MYLHSFLTHGLFLCSLAGMGYGEFWLLRRQEDGSRMLTQGKFRMACLVIPGLLNLMLFYSLAFHMHQSLKIAKNSSQYCKAAPSRLAGSLPRWKPP